MEYIEKLLRAYVLSLWNKMQNLLKGNMGGYIFITCQEKNKCIWHLTKKVENR